MKSSYLVLFFSFLFINSVSYSQSKKELEFELKLTKAKLDSIQNLYFQQQSQYQQKIVYLESIIDKVKFVLGNTATQPINNFSTQTITNSDVDVTKLPNGDVKQKTPIKLGDGDGLTPKTGGKIYTGSRGGQYYINKNGNKTYIKKKN
jgi:colicin import membrane protein